MKNKILPRDPVCGRRMNRNKAYVVRIYKGLEFFLCCPKCQAEFEKDTEKYLRSFERKHRL